MLISIHMKLYNHNKPTGARRIACYQGYNSNLIEMMILFLAGRVQLLPPSAHHVGRRGLGLRLEEAVQADQGAGRHDV